MTTQQTEQQVEQTEMSAEERAAVELAEKRWWDSARGVFDKSATTAAEELGIPDVLFEDDLVEALTKSGWRYVSVMNDKRAVRRTPLIRPVALPDLAIAKTNKGLLVYNAEKWPEEGTKKPAKGFWVPKGTTFSAKSYWDKLDEERIELYGHLWSQEGKPSRPVYTKEEREARKAETAKKKAEKAEKLAQWNALSDEEKAKFLEEQKAQRAAARKAMTPEDKLKKAQERLERAQREMAKLQQAGVQAAVDAETLEATQGAGS